MLVVLPLLGAVAQTAAGTWVGRYLCGQGQTGLALHVRAPGKDQLTALFHFFALPENPGVPTGCFTMTGAQDQAGSVTLWQEAWLLRPPDYEMVDLSGLLAAGGGSLAGAIGHESCSKFALVRGGAPELPAACMTN